MAKTKRIETPQGTIVKSKNGMSCRLKWNEGFKDRWKGKIDSSQKYVDSSCIRLMDKYTPMLSGMLVKSATLGTKIGEGEIHQIAPYARYLYYGVVFGPNIPIIKNGTIEGFYSPPKKHSTGREIKYSTSVHPLAGKMWFERMKADHLNEILKGAQRYAERG